MYSTQKNIVTGISGFVQGRMTEAKKSMRPLYEGWNFNSGNYLFTTDTK